MTRTDTAMYVAIAAAALAALLAIVVVYLLVVVRRLRANQRLVVGGSTHDLVEYAVGLLARVEACEQFDSRAVENSTGAAIDRIDGCLQRRALLRYDALEGSGGKQSATIVVTDAAGSGSCFRRSKGATTRASTSRTCARARATWSCHRRSGARSRSRPASPRRRSGRRGNGRCPRTQRVGGGGRLSPSATPPTATSNARRAGGCRWSLLHRRDWDREGCCDCPRRP